MATLDFSALPAAQFTNSTFEVVKYGTRSGDFLDIHGTDEIAPGVTLDRIHLPTKLILHSTVSDIPVNVFTDGSQVYPSVAMDAAGNFVVTWQSDFQDGDGSGIFARRFDALGKPLDALDIPVNVFTDNDQYLPSVAMDAAGNFVVTWESDGQDGDGYGIFARRFDALGKPLDALDIPVNVFTDNYQWSPSVAMDAAGNFVVTWESYFQDGDGSGIFARRFDALGNPLDALDIPVNVFTDNDQYDPSVAMDAAGNFVVTWESYCQDGDSSGIFARRFDALGNPLDALDIPVNVFTDNDQSGPSVAMDAAGNFVVTWDSYGQDGDSYGIFARRFDALGNPLDALDIPVNVFTDNDQYVPRWRWTPRGTLS